MQFFTVGPSALFPTCNEHIQDALAMDVASISHRSTAFRDIYQHTDAQLRLLLSIPNNYQIYFLPSATEIWERILLNTVQQFSFHFVQGAFSRRFYEFAQALNLTASIHTVQDGWGFDNINSINIPKDTELICLTHNETSSGIKISGMDITTLRNNYPDTLICMDMVSSAPLQDASVSDVDSAFFSVQKAFGMPAGLGVWIVNERMINKAKLLKDNNKPMGAHHTLLSFAKHYEKFETPSTPNVLAIYVLGKIAEDLNEIGIEN
jgi:Phosphoserine aminotransferase